MSTGLFEETLHLRLQKYTTLKTIISQSCCKKESSLRITVQFNSVQSFDHLRRWRGWGGGHDRRFGRDSLPVFSAGGQCYLSWHGQGYPLFDTLPSTNTGTKITVFTSTVKERQKITVLNTRKGGGGVHIHGQKRPRRR